MINFSQFIARSVLLEFRCKMAIFMYLTTEELEKLYGGRIIAV